MSIRQPSHVRLRTLGQSVVEVGRSRIEPSATHLFSFLLYLGIERGRNLARAELSSLLFPDHSPSDASHSIRQLIYRVKQLGAPLESTQSTLQLNLDRIEDDVAGVLSSPKLLDLACSSGNFSILPYYVPPTAPLSEWLEGYRDRTHSQLLRVLQERLVAARASADWNAVHALAKAALCLDAFNETATLFLAESIARAGSKRDALALLRQFEVEVGRSSESLTLPPRLLSKRLNASVSPSPSLSEVPLVGRNKDIARLSGLWARAIRGHCVSLALIGVESIGKSRLVSEFASLVRVDGTGTVMVTRCAPLDRHRPLSLFADACRQLASMPGAAGCSPSSIPFIARLTEAHTAHANADDPYDLDSRRDGLTHAVADILDSVLAERPLLWIVDDAEHLDEASLALLQELNQRLASRPCFVLLCARDIESAKHFPSRLRIRPLAPEATIELASALNSAGNLRLSRETLDWCTTLASGNPGQLHLLLSHRASSLNDPHAPVDLVAAIDYRISCLSSRAMHILQACSILGSSSTSDDLSALTGLRAYSLLSALQELEDDGLLLSAGPHLQCGSRLIQERALTSAPASVQHLLHRRAARRLERRTRSESPSQAVAWEIAEHWTRAGEFDSALRWKLICWKQWVAIGQPMAAAADIDDALTKARSPGERGTLLLDLATALRASGEFARLRDVLEERLGLGSHIADDASTRSALEFDLLEARSIQQNDLYSFANALALHGGNADLDVTRRLRASRLLMMAADHSFDANLAQRAYALHQNIPDTGPDMLLLRSHTSLIYHAVFGDRDSALAEARKLEQLSQQSERSWSSFAAVTTLTVARRLVDQGPQDFSALSRAIDETRALGMMSLASFASDLMTTCLFDDGRIDEALHWGGEARRLVADLSAPHLSIAFLTSQIDLALVTHELSAARALLRDLIALAPTVQGPRMQRELLVYRLRVSQLSGELTSEEDLATAWRLHKRASSFGRHDDHVEVLWCALIERGARRKASSMLAHYLQKSRREVRPCNYFLRLRTAADPVWRESTGAQFLGGIIRDCGQTSYEGRLPRETGSGQALFPPEDRAVHRGVGLFQTATGG
jgi:DNA-binding SARP family transcriptional activator